MSARRLRWDRIGARLALLLPTAAAVVWVVVACLIGLAPTLLHGTKIGSYDELASYGLGRVPGVTEHNLISGDQIDQMIPWATLAWRDVRAGHLPLWNPYSAMGTPLAFNFQSAVFSLPMLFAYLVPLRFVYTAYYIAKMVIGGVGVLFLCRVLGLRNTAGALGATIYELSGAFSGWAGWPMTTVLCMFGWVIGAELLVLRDPTRWRRVVGLGVAVAFAGYGGHPEMFAVLLATAVVIAVVHLAVDRRRARRAAARLAVGIVAGVALATPLLVPGLQLLRHAVDAGRRGYSALPWRDVVSLAAAAFYGLPTSHSVYFGPADYYETAAFVGVVALALAVLAVTCSWRQPSVLALAVAAVLLTATVWCEPVAHLLSALPLSDLIVWTRSQIVLDGVLAVLAAIGLQLVIDRGWERAVARRFLVVAIAASLTTAGLVLVSLDYTGTAESLRRRSLLWAVATAALTLLAAAGLLLRARRAERPSRRVVRRRPAVLVAAMLFGTEVVFLATAAPGIESSSHQAFAATPAERGLQRLAGQQRVGFAACLSDTKMPSLGIRPEANAGYRLAEMAMYDAILPRSYLVTYARLSHTPPATPAHGSFCPSMTSAAVARDYGVSLVVQHGGGRKPPGTVFDTTIGGEDVYRVPGGSVVTVQPLGAPLDDANAAAVRHLDHDGPQVLSFQVAVSRTSRLLFHIGNFPGWSATVDGHHLTLRSLYTNELQATIPPGTHRVVLTYHPAAFDVGLAVAVVAVVALVAGGIVATRRRRLSDPLGPSPALDQEVPVPTPEPGGSA